MNAMQHCVKLA